ncbi:hypothetical protein AMECASPLE_020784 [Ameca splendens]|uniref:Uncharacterized protein n=2 Tax=Goodeidae TaxID=28758 RepID=A0ABU7ALZ7_9TELE|nr:hypothetical protein [Ataeniobius toweri]
MQPPPRKVKVTQELKNTHTEQMTRLHFKHQTECDLLEDMSLSQLFSRHSQEAAPAVCDQIGLLLQGFWRVNKAQVSLVGHCVSQLNTCDHNVSVVSVGER